MDENFEYLLQHMANTGLEQEMIPGLIRDVANILLNSLLESRYVTCDLVNEKLAYLGWDESILDETSLQLIISILEQQGVLRAQAYTLH